MEADKAKKVVVLGAGVMGHSIAQVFAQAGLEVNLVDIDSKALDRAMTLIKSMLTTLESLSRVSSDQIPAILARIHLSTDLAAAVKGIDFVLEAVPEVPAIKKAVYAQLDEFCSKDTIIASNTSGLNIFNLVEVEHPERLAAAHWYAPPHIIPLVEVAPGPKTLPKVVDFTARLMERIGKKPVVMKKFAPGFIVNQIQFSIGQTVARMITEDLASPAVVDQALKLSLGIRLPIVGVLQSLDFNGLDVVHDIWKNMGTPFPLLEETVEKGHLGPKTSKGFYDYGGRSEEEILRKRDELYFKMLDHLEKINAFEPV